MELVLSSEMRQVWVRVSNDFSPFPPKKWGRWDYRFLSGVLMKRQLEGRAKAMSGWLEAYLLGLEVEGHSASNCIQLPSHHRCFPTYFLSHSQLLWTDLLYFTISFFPSSSSEGQPWQVITIWAKNCTDVNISDQAMKLQTSGLQITVNWGFWWANYCSISPIHLLNSSHTF